MFTHTEGQSQYSLAEHDPSLGGVTTIPTVLVPITLSFDTKNIAGKHVVLDARPELSRVLHSPVFSKFAFSSTESTQYADAMLRATFPARKDWHILLGQPEMRPIEITVRVGYGYILNSKKGGLNFAVVYIEFLQEELFKKIPRQVRKLLIALAENTTYYSDGDTTEHSSWGTHGVDSSTNRLE